MVPLRLQRLVAQEALREQEAPPLPVVLLQTTEQREWYYIPMRKARQHLLLVMVEREEQAAPVVALAQAPVREPQAAREVLREREAPHTQAVLLLTT